ncbi:HPr kinase/phosphorylase [Roseicyclus mahoneyensis]|uniref:Hpr(Ser) kinase/phosphatase n=1 Tax=Roseicyclus mahoneyensis TaxID=164332 RepID=A0A316GYE6_9RHOB|nr:serine kinase [Roseicyclus mahoneyensis]PWK60135.1 Hpr(Ser) kinase/phosphatase [Roseicyclus mahoneyensis]
MTTAAPEPEPITRWAAGTTDSAIWLNGTAVAVDDQGILILGASGTGKSGLALNLLALGAVLIADDGLWLDAAEGQPRIARPTRSPDLIEARGIGLIRAGTTRAAAPLAIIVDLDRAEPERLPPRRLVAIGEALCPLILGAGHNTLAPALVLMARHGRAEV